MSIIIPAHDDEPRIGKCIARATTAGRRLARTVELIVVDDASEDATQSRLARLQTRLDDRTTFIPLRSGTKRGKGWALRTGIAASRGARVILLDPGLDASPDDITTLTGRLDTVDLAYATASIPGLHPVITTRRLICRLMSGLELPAYPRIAAASDGPLLRRLAAATITDRSVWIMELLALAHHLGCSTAASDLPCLPGVDNRWPDRLTTTLRDVHRLAARLPRTNSTATHP